MEKFVIGRLLRSNTRQCVVGCPPSQPFPPFGSLVVIPLEEDQAAYGLISDIHIDDDGLVRQLVTTPAVTEAVIQDNRQNRNVPVEMTVLFVGSRSGGKISHLLPPRPPLSLDVMHLCGEHDLMEFTASGQFAYLRHIFEAQDAPATDLLAAHLLQAGRAHQAHGRPDWLEQACARVITMLRSDYDRLLPVLETLADAQRELAQAAGERMEKRP